MQIKQNDRRVSGQHNIMLLGVLLQLFQGQKLMELHLINGRDGLNRWIFRKLLEKLYPKVEYADRLYLASVEELSHIPIGVHNRQTLIRLLNPAYFRDRNQAKIRARDIQVPPTMACGQCIEDKSMQSLPRAFRDASNPAFTSWCLLCLLELDSKTSSLYKKQASSSQLRSDEDFFTGILGLANCAAHLLFILCVQDE
jgi:hypothetical protein